MLETEDTARIARELIGGNEHALRTLQDNGACDLSYSRAELRALPRQRVPAARQRSRSSCASSPTRIPSLAELNLPNSLAQIASLKNGIVLVTGPTGSGKSSTLAAMIDLINETRAEHIVTIEDPIEFLHAHKKATVHQRELHSDTPTFALALRAALRQAPKVILVGEMRDRETMEIALTAAETGHLVLSTLHTIDASKTVERIIGTFDAGDQQAVRTRLAASFRYFISQRLVPKESGGRIAVLEILKSTMRTRDYIERGDVGGKVAARRDARRRARRDAVFRRRAREAGARRCHHHGDGAALRYEFRQSPDPDRRHARGRVSDRAIGDTLVLSLSKDELVVRQAHHERSAS